MSTIRTRKKRVDQVDRSALIEPILPPEEQEMFNEGISLFNKREFWRAHESWENLWHRRPEESRIFYQGLIQAAAAYHLAIERPRVSGAIRNFEKSLEKLELFAPRFLGIDITGLITTMRVAVASLRREGSAGLEFPENLIPVLERKK